MKRKLYEKLVEWKQKSQGRSAVIIQGARRVGKSYIAEQFAKNEYDSYILIDFNRAGQQVRDIFLYDIENLDSFFLSLNSCGFALQGWSF